MVLDDNKYSTSDFGLAVSLHASDIKLAGIDKENPRRAVFIFVDSETTRDLVNTYLAGTLMVNAIKYFESTRRLKSRLYGD